MIEDEILEIMSDSADGRERLNGLANEFRHGRDVRELVPLLGSQDAELVSIAAWIFSELPEGLYSADEIVSRLRGLTAHVEPMVRFHALSAVYPFLNLAEPATQALLTKLTQDENDGVRRIAEAAVARLSSR
jgi:HEAT repeat protein